jgi:hypothetical protein
MKLKSRIFCSLIAALSGTGITDMSSAADPGLPPPKEPVLRRLASPASWTITFQYPDDTKQSKKGSSKAPSAPQAAPHLQLDRLEAVTVTKAGKVWREQSLWSSGNKTETWIFHDMRAGTSPGSHAIAAIAFSSDEPEALDYRRSDFEGLEWVAMEHYKGVKDYAGKPAYVFQFDQENAPAPAGFAASATPDPTVKNANARIGKLGMTKIAILSTETQLPLYSYDGVVERTYSYDKSPDTPLVPPENFMKVFRQLEMELKELHRGPSEP